MVGYLSKEYLKASDYEGLDAVDLKEDLSKKVNSFVTDDLVKIEKHIIDSWGINQK